MEWKLYNWSLNCPKDLEMPDCGFRGRPVQVNTDICCPEWECPCGFAFLTYNQFLLWGRFVICLNPSPHQDKVIVEQSSFDL